MLNPEDRDAIDGLFERIDTAARASGPRDEEAEALIRQRLRDAPASPYYMAQTLLMQEHALRVAEQRISELEAQVSRRPSGGILGGLFGNDEPQRGQSQPPRASAQRAPRGPWGESRDYEEERQNRRGGGGFLAGAAQTALGVTGGVLLGSAIAGMLTGGAHAQEMPADQPVDEPADEPVEDFDSGMDDAGDFDIGGDF